MRALPEFDRGFFDHSMNFLRTHVENLRTNKYTDKGAILHENEAYLGGSNLNDNKVRGMILSQIPWNSVIDGDECKGMGIQVDVDIDERKDGAGFAMSSARAQTFGTAEGLGVN
jgi:hypothetical protein